MTTPTFIDPDEIPESERMPPTVYVPLEDVCTDYKNPNAMSDGEFARLIESIRTLGFYQPVVLTPAEAVPDVETDLPFVMVDGFHRWRAVAALDWQAVPAVVGKDLHTAETIALRIAMNKNRGQVNLTVAAEQILELRDDHGFDMDQLIATGFSEQEIDTMIKSLDDDLSTVDPSQLGTTTVVDDDADPGANPRPFILELTFTTKDQRNAVRRALKTAGNGDATVGLLALTGVEE